jgi:hypothetical protein
MADLVSQFIYTTDYLKVCRKSQAAAIEFRADNGRIMCRPADLLCSVSTEQVEWAEVSVEQLTAYSLEFPAMVQWLKLIRYRGAMLRSH